MDVSWHREVGAAPSVGVELVPLMAGRSADVLPHAQALLGIEAE